MNQKRKMGWQKHIDFMILDIICLLVAFNLAILLRHQSFHVFVETNLYAGINLLLIVIDLCYVLIRKAYKNILKRHMFQEMRSVFVQNIVIWIVLMTVEYMTQQIYLVSRIIFVIAVIFSLIFMAGARLVWKRFVRNRLNKGKNLPNILVVTTRKRAPIILDRFRSLRYNGFNMRGFIICDEDLAGEKIDGVDIVCDFRDMYQYVKDNVIDEVMLSVPDKYLKKGKTTQKFLDMGVVVHLAMDYLDDPFPNSYMQRIGGFTVLTTSVNTAANQKLFVKRIFDVIAGLIGCAITGVLFLFVAPRIKVLSPGPVFYKQVRVGTNGRQFEMYKFRSMYPDADERKQDLMEQNQMEGHIFKISNDPRIIGSEKGPGKGFGNFIRRTSIDEFPQFYNILKGDMSLVGTRPPTVDEVETYDLHHKIRLSMKPGLTGMWQVSGRSAITDFEDIVALDTYYIEHWSIKLDLKLIIKTFGVVLTRKGAE